MSLTLSVLFFLSSLFLRITFLRFAKPAVSSIRSQQWEEPRFSAQNLRLFCYAFIQPILYWSLGPILIETSLYFSPWTSPDVMFVISVISALDLPQWFAPCYKLLTSLDVVSLFFLIMSIILSFIAFCGLSGILVLLS